MIRTTLNLFILVTLFQLPLIANPIPALAHDEGHGPKLTDAGRYGGLVSSVILSKESDQGEHAAVLYKAELVRNSEGTVRVYLYDQKMKPISFEKFDTQGGGELIASEGGEIKNLKFEIKLERNHFIGEAPQSPSKPFNLEFTFKEGSSELLTAFENLD